MKSFSLLAFTLLSLTCLLPASPLTELAFDRREFVRDERLAASPDGQWLAYSVRQKPSDFDFNQRHLLSGTPSNCVGSQIVISDLEGQIYHLLSNGSSWRPVWSPDSKQLAYYSDATGVAQLWVFDMELKISHLVSKLPIKSTWFPLDVPSWHEGGQKLMMPVANAVKTVRLPVEEVKPEGPKWLSTQTVPTFEEKGAAFYIEQYCSSILSVDCKTGEEKMVIPSTTQPFPAFHRISPSGQWLSYLSPLVKNEASHGFFDLAITQVDGSTPVKTLTTDLMTGEGFFAACYQWHPTKDLLVYVKEQKLYLVEMDEEESKPAKCLNSEPLDLIGAPLHYTLDGSYVIAGGTSTPSEQYPDTAYLISLSGNKVVEIPFKTRWEYLQLFQASGQQIWQPEKDSITFFLKEKETGLTAVVRYYWNEEGQVEEKVLWTCFGDISHPMAIRNEVFAIYEDVATPPNIFRFNSDFSKKERITTLDPRLDLLEAPDLELHQTLCPLWDGTIGKLKTTIIFPKKSHNDERFPAVVCFYPGANLSISGREFMGGDHVGILHSMLLLQKGYALIFPEIPLTPEGQAGHPLQEMTDALLPQVYHAIEKGLIDPLKIGLLGHSYGGYGTVGILSKTDLFSAGIASSGLYDLAAGYGDIEMSDFFEWWAEKGQGRMGASPWHDPSRYLENSPYYHADKIHTPLLLLHGENDKGCKGGTESIKMFMALKRLNKRAELLLYPNEGHTPIMWSKSNAIDVSQRVLDFFDRHLKQRNDN